MTRCALFRPMPLTLLIRATSSLMMAFRISSSRMENRAYGKEGVDWIRNADGTAAYPNGGDSAEYHMSDFMYGSILTICPWEGEDPDLRTQQRTSNAELAPSKYVGFAIDTTPVSSEVTACANIKTTYKPMLASGAYGSNTEATWEKFINELHGAGMDKILAEYQRQLDAWLAEQ